MTGFGVVSARGNTLKWVDSGVIKPPKSGSLPEKLTYIHRELSSRIERHEPDLVCVEEAFYAKNVRTTLVLGHARGVALLAACQSGVGVAEFSPREIKKAVVGNGNASKDQIMYMVRMLLSPPDSGQQVDACDALAAALCGYYHRNSRVPSPVKTRGAPRSAIAGAGGGAIDV